MFKVKWVKSNQFKYIWPKQLASGSDADLMTRLNKRQQQTEQNITFD